MPDFPYQLAQNPSPVSSRGQEWHTAVEEQADVIMALFRDLLPSNYVAKAPGPHYWMQFRAAAVELAKIQLEAQAAYKDTDYTSTRPEFLFQILGHLVHPESDEGTAPDIDGDKTYRTYLAGMVQLLLAGSTKASVKSGIELLTDAEVTVLEKAILARGDPGSAWDMAADQFSFEVNVMGEGGQQWPAENPFTLRDNVALALRALRPAHTLYTYRNLFTETFGTLFTASPTYALTAYYYEDLRRLWWGAEALVGTAGSINAARTTLTDTARDFVALMLPTTLQITSGVNLGEYTVTAITGLPFTTDATTAAYTTTPTGLSGTATVVGGAITDAAQDWTLAVEGELLTFTEGSNLGTYRLATCIGPNGGPIRTATGPCTGVLVAMSTLTIRPQPPSALASQAYTVGVDRLGVTTPQSVVGEDSSNFFVI